MSQQRLAGDCPPYGDTLDDFPHVNYNTTSGYASSTVQDSQVLYGEHIQRPLLGPASMPSSSPVSMTFSSDSMSQVNPASQLATPTTSHIDLPHDQLVRRPSKIHPQEFESTNFKVKNWIHFDGTNPAGKKGRTPRACYQCFIRKQPCEPGMDTTDPNRCMYCKDSGSYCRNPIQPPSFMRVDLLRNAASSALARMRTIPDGPSSDVLHLETLHQEPQPVVQRSLPMLVSLPFADFPYLQELPTATEMLDSLLDFNNSYPLLNKAGDEIAKFEGRCRRFCACVTLLRSLNTCKVDPHVKNCHQVFRLALGFVMRLSLLARDLLKSIFEQISSCCEASRHPRRTPKIMSSLASFLGQILAETRHLHQYAKSFPKLPIQPIFEQIYKTQKTLTYYGKAFDNNEFVTGSRIKPRSLPGLHLQISDPSSSVPKVVQDTPSKDWPSVFSILNIDFANNTSQNFLYGAFDAPAPAFVRQVSDTADYLESTDAHLDTFLAVRRGVLVKPATITQRVLFKPVDDEIAKLRSKNAQIQVEIDRLHACMLENDEKIKGLGEPPSPGISLMEESSEQHSLCGSTEKGDSETRTQGQLEMDFPADLDEFWKLDLEKAREMVEDPFLRPSPREGGEDVDMADATAVDDSKQDRKRKRFSSPAVSKKEKDDTELDSTAPTVTDASDKRAAGADAQTSCSKLRSRASTIVQFKQHLSEVLCDCSQLHNTEKAAALESSDPNDLEDVGSQASSCYERRPKTWPFRHVLRRSVDISVRTLVKGFEKLNL